MALDLKYTFDDKNYRDYLNGFSVVLHCHRYMSLTTKFAEDFDDIGGTRVLMDTAEDTMRPIFDEYTKCHPLHLGDARLKMAAEFYSIMGMGKIDPSGNADAGKVISAKSHADQGWIKKWGPNKKPVNYFIRGYIAAMYAAAFDQPARSYEVTETDSIVTGTPVSSFTVAKR